MLPLIVVGAAGLVVGWIGGRIVGNRPLATCNCGDGCRCGARCKCSAKQRCNPQCLCNQGR